MTKKERLYLRSAYHHFDEMLTSSASSLIHDGTKFSRYVVDAKLLQKIVYLVLSLEAGEDGSIEMELRELLEDNQIPLLYD